MELRGGGFSRRRKRFFGVFQNHAPHGDAGGLRHIHHRLYGRLERLSHAPPLYEKKISYASNHPVYFAGVIISLIPILVLFGAFQNTIMSNVYAGGLKG